MKRSLLLLALGLVALAPASGQMFAVTRSPGNMLYAYRPGYSNITGIGNGFGLGDVSVDYSRSVFSLSTVNGYLINHEFFTGLGTGINLYNGGATIPLYVDLRYSFLNTLFEPILVADGGLLIRVGDGGGGTALFIHPAFGVRRVVSNRLAVNLCLGPMVHTGMPEGRSTFFMVDAGLMITKKYMLRKLPPNNSRP